MATSSILHNIVITDPQKAEAFINALEASANDPKRVPSGPIAQQLTDPDEIRKFLANKSNSNKGSI